MKIICIGRNYADHIAELQHARPDEPVVFIKPDTAIAQSNLPFFIPEFSNDVHHEVEVLVKINRIGKHIQSKFEVPAVLGSLIFPLPATVIWTS